MSIEIRTANSGETTTKGLSNSRLEEIRRVKFFNELKKYGLDSSTTETQVIQTARQLTLDQARRLHEISFKYRNATFIGSMVLEEQFDVVRMVDLHDPYCRAENDEGEFYWQRHFYPFGSNDKQQQYALDTVYLAFADMLNVVEFADNEADQPQFIRSTTNPTMANFVRNSLQFHLSGAFEVKRTKDSRYEHVGIVPEDEVEMVFQDQVAIKDSLSAYDTDRTQILFDQFLSIDELLCPEYRTYLEAMKQSVYQHAFAIGRTQTPDADGYEKEIRVRASLVNLAKLNEVIAEERKIELELEQIRARLQESKRQLEERRTLRAQGGLPQH